MNVSGLRFAANMSILYGHLPLLERPAAAAADGFDAVECWWPFSSPVPDDRETDAFAAALDAAGVRLVAMNLVEGDMRFGDRGLLSSPRRHGEFRAGINTAVGFTARTDCRIFNALYGNREPDVDPVRQDQLALESLAAAATADTIGATVVLEAISLREAPDYPLGDADAAVTAADAVNAVTGLTNTGVLCASTTTAVRVRMCPRCCTGTRPASRTCRSPTTPAAAVPARARWNTRPTSQPCRTSGTRAGSGWSTSRLVTPPSTTTGCRPEG